MGHASTRGTSLTVCSYISKEGRRHNTLSDIMVNRDQQMANMITLIMVPEYIRYFYLSQEKSDAIQ
jgi:hypothetical protein